MIDCTDQYFRQLIRLISKRIYLYTEMITAHALKNGNVESLLAYDAVEHPVALQVGGSIVKDLVHAARLASDFGYDEVNLNVGCPSDRVQAGRFGACLMKEPERVAESIAAMQSVVDIPVTVKTRIGVDNFDGYDFFHQFIDIVRQAGCNVFIIHARKAWLKGLSPKQNRNIPELKYEFVHQLKNDFPDLELIINGGIKDLDISGQFNQLDGIMVGREAYANPYHLSCVDKDYYDRDGVQQSRKDILLAFAPVVENALNHGFPASILLKHIFGLSRGITGGAVWRRLGTMMQQKQKPFLMKHYLELVDAMP